MYVAPPPKEDQSRYQAKLLVNMVVVVFLVVGLLLVLQHFRFLYLREIPLIGDWLMDIYERIFGVPKVAILHGEDSVGDWEVLQNRLSERLIFYSEDIDVGKFSAGMGAKLNQYSLIIVEDARRLDKDKLLNLIDYVEGGGNLIWVGDAGTQGIVQYEDTVLANQTGWVRRRVCIDSVTLSPCDCKTVKQNGTCKFLPSEAEQSELDFTAILGLDFLKNVMLEEPPRFEIVDRAHWSVAGINLTFQLTNVDRIASAQNRYDTALVANIVVGDKQYPGVVVNDQPGTWGAAIYFAYPPEETMEVLLPIVERLRY